MRSRSPGTRLSALDVVRIASGNFPRNVRFMVFGYFAAAIEAAYFPSGDAFRTLLKSLATSGVGFLMRPLGAVVLGAFTDRHGRRAGLLLTLTLMSVGIVTLTIAPGYATIGLLAPVLVSPKRSLRSRDAALLFNRGRSTFSSGSIPEAGNDRRTGLYRGIA